MATVTKKVMAMAARLIATATRRARARAARGFSTATRMAVVEEGNGKGYGDKAGGQAMAATMAMGMGTAQRTWPLTLRPERGV
jgi:hypothetical protein